MSTLTPPNSKQSEMMVLGCMLTQPTSLNIAADALHEDDFYYTEHRLIFSVLQGFYKRDKAVDVHLTCEELIRLNKLDAAGGIAYITALAEHVGTSAWIEDYAELVRQKSLLRKIIIAAQNAQKIAMSNPEDPESALDEIEQGFFKVTQRARPTAGVALAELLAGVKTKSQIPFLKELQKRQELYQERGPEDVRAAGLPTHLRGLDRLLNGLGDSNLMILAARPAMGKTALALNIAENVALLGKQPVGIFSLEMTAEQVRDRMISSQSGVPGEKIRMGNLTGAEFQVIVSSVQAMMGHSIVIDDQPGMRVTELRSRARRMVERFSIKLLVIDYLQLLSGPGGQRDNDGRQFEIAEISRQLKTLARELDIPILCLSQLSRKVDDRTNHRPMMSDIRESGAIEQDADVIMFLLRREYYDKLDKPGLADLIIAKNRHGRIGDVPLCFNKDIAKFTDYSTEPPSDFDRQAHSAQWDCVGVQA